MCHFSHACALYIVKPDRQRAGHLLILPYLSIYTTEVAHYLVLVEWFLNAGGPKVRLTSGLRHTSFI